MKYLSIVALASLSVAACSKDDDKKLTIPVEPITRQTIVVDAQATGVVEPINVIEVKAKSSGQIVAMPVETGTFVKPGDLLVQLDTRDTRNSYAQAKADLDAANIKLRVSRSARDRAAQLFKERIITAQEHEAAQVDFANSQATVLRNRAALDLRAQGLEEATVRAPVAGTVIEKTVALGQVIASGTSSFGGGTTILKMADLTKVRVRTLVNETDIGKVRPGLSASVNVDAFPDRPFVGTVEKIEPQATIQQSVTMFPVLVSIDNEQRLLMPGMNGEVSIQVERRENVLAVPNDAVRSPNEIASVATMLGLDPDSVRAQMRASQSAQRGTQSAQSAEGSQSAGTPRGGPAQVTTASNGNGDPQSRSGGRFQMPEVTDQQCQAVTAAMTKNPDTQAKLDALRERMRSGELDRQAMQAESQKIYAAIGLGPAVARACMFRQRGGGQFGGNRASAGNGDRGVGSANGGERSGGAQQGTSSGQTAMQGGGMDAAGTAARGGRGGRGRRAMVFTVKDGKYTPRVVRLGVSNYDVAEVLDGLQEGDQVAILNVAAMQARQQNELDQMRGRTGMPGMQRQQQGGQGGPGGGAGGAQGGAGARGGAGGQRGGGF
ncbi:MAG TPA: efflux RND transporter periplasmic adaptor subunit [Gemmatimonadaceae bacterium]|nr:efflux RND transporter periplasmic adaptor subunit [Gemmatimonadaceae bacterium]